VVKSSDDDDDLLDASEKSASRLCYSIQELRAATGFSRQLIYAEIRDRKLVARRIRSRTVVLADEAMAWLRNAPTLEPGASVEC
jgi:hypothetical protein